MSLRRKKTTSLNNKTLTYIFSELSDSETELNPPDFLPTQTHTVAFKCVGSVHDEDRLSRTSKILRESGNADVQVSPEPSNPYDSQAIAFQFHIDHNWQRIGYVVREYLSHFMKLYKRISEV